MEDQIEESLPSTSQVLEDVEIRAVEYMLESPDGGWGWVIVAAAFYCCCIIDGITFSFGIYLPDIVKTYDATEASVALIGSCMFGLHLGAGPLTAALTKSFGFRPTVILGSVITAASLASSIFTPPLWLLTITLGILTGIGMCLIYMNCITLTSIYFDKRRLLAMGIVVSGTGFGTAFFALAGNYMLDRMTWQQAMLVLAFCSLLMAIAGLTFRPLEPVRVVTLVTDSGATVLHKVSLWDEDDGVLGPKVMLRRRSSVESAAMAAIDAVSQQMYAATITRDGFSRWCYPCMSWIRPYTQKYETMSEGPVADFRTTMPTTELPTDDSRGQLKPSVIDEVKRSRWELIKESAFLDWGLLKDYHFFLFCISGGICCTAIVMIFTFEEVRIIEAGMSKEMGTYFVAAMGVANMFWRLFLGYVASYPKVGYHMLNVSSQFIGGVFIILSIYVQDISFYVFICVMCGCAVAAFAIFRPILVLDLVGIEKISDGGGISLMFTGIMAIGGPPLGGYLSDKFGSYEYVYYAAGALLIISGFMLWFTAYELRKRQLAAELATMDRLIGA